MGKKEEEEDVNESDNVNLESSATETLMNADESLLMNADESLTPATTVPSMVKDSVVKKNAATTKMTTRSARLRSTNQ